jgi:hypothetical protein
MNKFDLNGVEEKEIRLLERKKKYIMGRVDELSM